MRLEQQNSFGRTFYTIEYNPSLDIVDTVWTGFASDNDLRLACEVGLRLHEETKCAFKLNDNSTFTGLWSESVTWLETEWLPRAMAAGVKYLAHVAKKNSFGAAAGEVMGISSIGQQLQYCHFASRQEALAWLATCQQQEAPV
jgi:hypothetical protein